MDWNPPQAWDRMADFLRGLQATLPAQPRAIVLVSAHWLEPTVSVTSGAKPALIYDYHGFPAHTYGLQYPAPGDPQLAGHITDLLLQAQLPAQQNPSRGFDHGMFIPLLLMFPKAHIPVVQLSLHSTLDAQMHLQIGQTLEPLRSQGVLIIGSGMSFHNMRGYGDPRFGPISDAFDNWLTRAVESEPGQRHQALIEWSQAPSAQLCHPPNAQEHLLPLMVVAGAAHESTGRRVFFDRVMETVLSGFVFG
jgi:aromatic ring-opening dioxygenase catalytic subunit (LigB family)